MPFLTRFAIFAVLALGLGLGSAWRAVSHGFSATTQRFGPWALWFREGMGEADPYTIAHVARLGTLPMTATAEMTFIATRDSAGLRLSGDCTYEIRGYAVPALWWSVAAFDASGEMMPNKTNRSSFSSTNMAMAPDGSFIIRLSSEVQPGNWLPATRGNRLVLTLTFLRPLNPGSLLKAETFPEIDLAECS